MHKITEVTYKNILKPILFTRDPEFVHDKFTNTGRLFSQNRLLRNVFSSLYNVNDDSLKTNVNGLDLENPVGLSAGFDYNGYMSPFLPSLSFGFNTVGTVTAREYEGNHQPRLLRLPQSQSLLVNKGFKSLGADNIEKILDDYRFDSGALGISIGSTNIEEINTIEKAIDDYLYTFNVFKVKEYVKYFEINISCPNTKMPESFSEIKNLELLLSEISKLNIKKPLFIKLANEVEEPHLAKQLEVCLKHNINTAILSNLVKKRDNPSFNKEEITSMKDYKGNFSGKPCQSNSNKLIQFAYKNFSPDLKIIGVGGIFSGEDAYEKIQLGASAVQLITGLIYNGPQLIGQINKDLIKFMRRDGFANIQDAVGSKSS